MLSRYTLATAVFAGLIAVSSAADAALVYEYNAGKAPDDGSDATWEPSVNTSLTRDWSLANHAFNLDAGSNYPGIDSSYSFSGSSSGGTTATFGQPNLPLGGGQSNAAGASSTWEIWVRPDRNTLDDIGDEVLVETGGTTNGHTIAFQAASGGVDLVYHVRSNNGNGSPFTITESLTDDSLLDDFMQVVAVIDPNNATEDDTRLYLNGQLVASNGGWTSWQRGNNDAGLGRVNSQIGGGDISGGSFNGAIAILRIYDEPMSDQDVQSLWTATTIIPEPSTFLIWSLGFLGLAACAWRRRSK